jgi:hypothetical protein
MLRAGRWLSAQFWALDAESTIGVCECWRPAGMGDVSPFIGTEALASSSLTRYELRRYYRAIMPNVYLDNRVEPSLHQRTVGAWLWTGRGGGGRACGLGSPWGEVYRRRLAGRTHLAQWTRA